MKFLIVSALPTPTSFVEYLIRIGRQQLAKLCWLENLKLLCVGHVEGQYHVECAKQNLVRESLVVRSWPTECVS